MSRIGKVRDWVKDIGDHIETDCEVAFIYDSKDEKFFSEITLKGEDVASGTLKVDFERSDFTPKGYHKFLNQLTEQVDRLKT